jgi:hypothetical protein
VPVVGIPFTKSIIRSSGIYDPSILREKLQTNVPGFQRVGPILCVNVPRQISSRL